MKTFAISVLALLSGCCLGYYLTFDRNNDVTTAPLTIVDTIHQTYTDTIHITVPRYIKQHSSHAVTLPTRSTILHCDSDSVTILATTHIYADSNYRAVISGVNPSLDSLTLYHPTCTITRTVTCFQPVSTPAKNTGSRLGLGITAGIAATSKGFSPGITLGITYRLWH